MSQNNPVILHVGLDVAKLSLQLHLAGQPQALTNDPKGHAQLLKLLSPHPHAHVICEATGGYEQPVVQVLQTAGIPISVIAPSRVRYYARAHNLRAKTDPIDAALLARFGAEIKPAPTPGVSVPQKRLADLCQRRRQLIDIRTMEHNRSEHYTNPSVCARPASFSKPWRNKSRRVIRPLPNSSLKMPNWLIKPAGSMLSPALVR